MACSGDIEWCDAELTCMQELRIRQVQAWPGSAVVIVFTGNRYNIQGTVFSDNKDSLCIYQPQG